VIDDRCTCEEASCPNPGGHPFLEGELYDLPTTDPSTIIELWSRYRWAGVAVAPRTGQEAVKGVLVQLEMPGSDTSKVVRSLLESSHALTALAMASREEKGAFESLLFRLREARAQAKEVEALRRAVSAESKRARTRPAEPGSPSMRVREILADAPVQQELVVPRGWALDPRGVFRLVEDGESVRSVAVSSQPIVILERLTDVAEETESLRLAWSRDGRWQEHIVNRGQTASQRNIVDLADRGCAVTTTNAGSLVDYLADFEAVNIAQIPRTRVSRRIGWIGDDGQHSFLAGRSLIHPGGELAEMGHVVRFHGLDVGDEQLVDGFCVAGSYEEWLGAVRMAAAYPRVMVMLFGSLAAPLLHILRAPNFVINGSGVTSTGKTTALRLGASAWGNPDERASSPAMWTWDTASRVFFERASMVLNGVPLVVDDTQRAKNQRVVEQVVYDFASGRGKGRGSRKGLQQQGSWRTILLSTGESPITSFCEDGGAYARVLEVWGAPFGPGDSGGLVNELNTKVLQNYGHAGPMLVQYLLRNQGHWDHWRSYYQQAVEAYARRAGANPVGSRLATYFGTLAVAAGVAKEALGFPWEYFAAVDALWGEVVGEGDQADRATVALRHVVAWCKANTHAFWDRNQWGRDGAAKVPVGGWAGQWTRDNQYVGYWEYIAVVPHVLKNLLERGGFKSEAIIRTWKERGWLRTEKDRYQYQVGIDGEKVRTIAITRQAVELVENQ